MKRKLFISGKRQFANALLIAFILFGVVACEGIAGGDGYVYSSKTLLPLANTQVTLILNGNRMNTFITDSTGFFRGSKFGGCVPRCPTAEIEFKREGYKTFILSMDSLRDANYPNRDSLIVKLAPLT
jgi:hypothetical protein